MLLEVGGGAGGEGISEGVEEELLQLRSEAALVGSGVGFDSHEFEEVEAAIEEGVEVRPGTAGLRRNLGNLFPYDPLVWDQLLAGLGAGPYYTVPFYTLHKLMAGLLDQWEFAGNAKAFEMVKKMAAWVRGRVEATLASGGEELWQRVLQVEWGGMNDVLFHLYEHTRDPSHLSAARRFNSYVFTASLAAGVDGLSSLPFPHANFRLPSVVGHARAHELTGNATDARIVEAFLGAVVSNHSYATGGSSSGECWQDPRDLGAFLGDQTQESCTQFNVLKVARRAFLSSGDAGLADFYERAVLNGIVGNQDRRGGAEEATSYIYMQPLGGPSFKPWGKSDFGFPCCWGTLSEAFSKLSDSVFFASSSSSSSADGPSLYVNQFVSATARLRILGLPGVSVEQKALFPTHPTETSKLTVHGAGEFSMMIRVPGWSDPAESTVRVNGVSVASPGSSGGSSGGLEPGSYVRLQRAWVDGDTVEASFPLRVWSDPINDFHPEYNATIAFMYGPLVLAGVHMDTDVWVPKGGPEAAKADPASFITLNSTAESNEPEFEAEAAGGSKMKMIPLKDVMDERYVVYFMTAGTKPPQPEVVYCPHSPPIKENEASSSSASGDDGLLGLVGSTIRLPGGVNDHDQDLVSRGAPPSAPPVAATRDMVIQPPLRHSSGDESTINTGLNDA